MGADKGGMKTGGFFNLFDWNRKSRKKLFSNVSPESAKQGKLRDENLRKTHFQLIDEGESMAVSSVKGSSNHSCASSVTDEEGNGIKAPGVVARLMGLDSMPTSGVSEPYRTPLFDTQSLRDNRCNKRSPEFYINDQFNHTLHRGEGYSRKLMELRSQKMPSSPIERFQTEILPPRSAKSLSMAHHKLLSPIKNPSFISPKNAAHIMEAAVKILEPGLQAGMNRKISSFGPASIPLKVHDLKESLIVSQRTSRIPESVRTPAHTTDARYLQGQSLNRSWNGLERASVSRIPESATTAAHTSDAGSLQGQSLNRGWNGSESTSVFRLSPESEGNPLFSAKDKGKSISLAVQAKVNVQRREGLSTENRNTSHHGFHEECRLDQPFKSQSSNQRNKPQKKPLTAISSGVLRQNNQKQNCPSSKARLASKQSSPNQQGRKVLPGDSYSGRNRTVSKLSGTSRVGYRKELETAKLDLEGSTSSNKDFPQKKRLIDRGFPSDKVELAVNTSVSRLEKHVKPNVVIDEHVRWRDGDRRDGMDVVSFTFTSPLIKPMHGSQFSAQVVEKLDNRERQSFDTSDKNALISKNKRLSPLGLSTTSGDALSLLLERKLRELTAGVELSDCSFAGAGSSAAWDSLMQESGITSAPTGTGVEHVKSLQMHCKDKTDPIFSFGVSSTNGHALGIRHKLQGVEEAECSSSNDARKELDHKIRSPLSVLEASASIESCNSSESKPCSSAQAQTASSASKTLLLESESELLDSASSTFTEDKDDFQYVKEILQRTGSCYLDLDPLLFDKMENKRSCSSAHREGKGTSSSRLRRKMVFDCVSECLDLRASRYFRTGYRAWTRGVATGKDELAEEIWREISGWRSMGEWMVDELVGLDMCSQVGRWADFEVDAFEAGVEIEREILSSLVDEVIADFSCSF